MTCHTCHLPIEAGDDWFSGLAGNVAHWACQPEFKIEWQARPQYRAAWLAGWKLARATFDRRRTPKRIRITRRQQSALNLGSPAINWPHLAELTLNPADVAGLEEVNYAAV
mgnify:CR=1 FL=1